MKTIYIHSTWEQLCRLSFPHVSMGGNSEYIANIAVPFDYIPWTIMNILRRCLCFIIKECTPVVENKNQNRRKNQLVQRNENYNFTTEK